MKWSIGVTFLAMAHDTKMPTVGWLKIKLKPSIPNICINNLIN